MFGVTNGVRQGGVVSPVFFNILMDDLLTRVCRNLDLVQNWVECQLAV